MSLPGCLLILSQDVGNHGTECLSSIGPATEMPCLCIALDQFAVFFPLPRTLHGLSLAPFMGFIAVSRGEVPGQWVHAIRSGLEV